MKATFIYTSKMPIFEWGVAILFIHLWGDKKVLVSMILLILWMPQEDQQDYYPVISFPLTSICYCTVLQTLGYELYLMPKATLIYVLKNIFFFVMHYQKTASLSSVSFFRTRLLQNTYYLKYIFRNIRHVFCFCFCLFVCFFFWGMLMRRTETLRLFW